MSVSFSSVSSSSRERSVYVDQDPDLVLVFDRASGACDYQQLWHLDPGLTVTTVTRSYAVATAPGTQLEIRQIPLPGQQFMCRRAGSTSTEVPGSHAIYVSNPSAVAALITTAATSPKLAAV